MKKKDFFLLYLISATFYAVITLLIRVPGYMDADYYYAGGIQIAIGNGAVEPYIWNYLNSPTTIPVPSFSYWMPFTSILAAGGMKLLGSTDFSSARLLFVLLAGLIPVISAGLAERFLPFRRSGWIAGSIAMVSTYYLPYMTVTDSITPFMVFGGIFILLLTNVYENRIKPLKNNWWKFTLLGILAGILHLSRADGLLWLIISILVIIIINVKSIKSKDLLKIVLVPCLLISVAYLLLLSPWLVRNIQHYHSLFPPGNTDLMLATGYDDIFFYDPSVLTINRFLSQGFNKIFTDRLHSLWMNIKSLLLVNGGIVLVPMVFLAAWTLRKTFIVRITVLIALINLIFMSFVFPYAGFRGGFLHSNSAIQPILWGLVPLGLEKMVQFGILHRGWKLERSWKLFSVTLIAVSFAISCFIFTDKLLSSVEGEGRWNDTLSQFEEINQEIIRISGDRNSVIMVNNPPGYFLATSRLAIVNPTDGLENLLVAADTFSVRFFVLDDNNTVLTRELEKGLPSEVNLLARVGNSKIYEIEK